MPLVNEFKLIELIALNQEYQQLEQTFKPLEYLASISEKTLWEFYQPAIESPDADPGVMKDLGNKESLNKLKFRSIEERLCNLEAAVQGSNIKSSSSTKNINPQEESKIADPTLEDLNSRILLV